MTTMYKTVVVHCLPDGTDLEYCVGKFYTQAEAIHAANECAVDPEGDESYVYTQMTTTDDDTEVVK